MHKYILQLLSLTTPLVFPRVKVKATEQKLGAALKLFGRTWRFRVSEFGGFRV